MIIDPGRIMSGTSVSRMSAYLSLCKIDCVVRKAVKSAPSRRVDQPSKVGQAGTMARPSHAAKPDFSLRVDNTRKIGNRAQTLTIKRELGKRSGIIVDSLTEVGTVILQQDGKDVTLLPLYSAATRADNFAKKRKEWMFCLVVKQQEQWVNAILNLLGRARLESDCYLLSFRQGQIRHLRVPNSQRR